MFSFFSFSSNFITVLETTSATTVNIKPTRCLKSIIMSDIDLHPNQPINSRMKNVLFTLFNVVVTFISMLYIHYHPLLLLCSPTILIPKFQFLRMRICHINTNHNCYENLDFALLFNFIPFFFPFVPKFRTTRDAKARKAKYNLLYGESVNQPFFVIITTSFVQHERQTF